MPREGGCQTRMGQCLIFLFFFILKASLTVCCFTRLFVILSWAKLSGTLDNICSAKQVQDQELLYFPAIFKWLLLNALLVVVFSICQLIFGCWWFELNSTFYLTMRCISFDARFDAEISWGCKLISSEVLVDYATFKALSLGRLCHVRTVSLSRLCYLKCVSG